MTAIQKRQTKYGSGMTALFTKYSQPRPARRFNSTSVEALLDFNRPAKVFTFGSDTIIVLHSENNTQADYVSTYLFGRMD